MRWCGAVAVLDPMWSRSATPFIVVEVISPRTHKVDTTQKLADYFRIPSVMHYLIVNTSRRAVVHHERGSTAPLPPGLPHRVL